MLTYAKQVGALNDTALDAAASVNAATHAMALSIDARAAERSKELKGLLVYEALS